VIEALEREQGELASELSRPGFYQGDAALQARVHARLATLPAELEVAYARWESLDARR
jgi:ATP-binding cassette subfamily F protein uup